MNKQAGEILKRAREKRRWTQADLAEKLAEGLGQTYSQRQYQKLEDGHFPKFKKTIAEKLDELLNLNLVELVYEQDVPHETENQLNEPEAKYFTKTDLIEVIKAIKGTDDIHIIELIKKYVEDSSEKIAEKVKEKIMDNNKGDPRHSSHSKAGSSG